MCDPVTLMSLAGTAISATGSVAGGVQAFSGAGTTAGFLENNAAIQSGNAELALGNAAILKKQADVMRDSAEVARARARVALARTQDEGARVSAGQIAGFASRNLDPAFGSPLLLQLETASRVKGDMDLIAASAEVDRADLLTKAAGIDVAAAGETGRAASFYSRAASTYGQALSTRQKGGQALTAGIVGAATSLLSGGSKLAGKSGGGAFLPSFSFLDHGIGGI